MNKERFQGYLQIDGFTLYELGETGGVCSFSIYNVFILGFHFPLHIVFTFLVGVYNKILFKRLEPPLISLDFAKKMRNRCSDLLKPVKIMKIQLKVPAKLTVICRPLS